MPNMLHVGLQGEGAVLAAVHCGRSGVCPACTRHAVHTCPQDDAAATLADLDVLLAQWHAPDIDPPSLAAPLLTGPQDNGAVLADLNASKRLLRAHEVDTSVAHWPAG